MNRVEIEGLVHRVIEDLENGRPVEDDRIELKREWPIDFQKAARRVAGHANSAGQEPIIWLIGIDESSRTVIGADAQDPADWFQRLQSVFADGWAPAMVPHNIPRGEKIVVALVFETEGAPYLVKVKDTDLLEVPWRSSTRTRSAKRHEIFSILSVPTAFPDFEILDGELTAQENRVVPPDKVIGHTLAVKLTVYVTPRSDRTVFFPLHRTRFIVQFEGAENEFEIGTSRAQAVDDDSNVTVDDRQIAVRGPAFIKLFAAKQLPILTCPDGAPLVRVLMSPAGSARAIELRAQLTRSPRSMSNFHCWTLGGD